MEISPKPHEIRLVENVFKSHTVMCWQFCVYDTFDSCSHRFEIHFTAHLVIFLILNWIKLNQLISTLQFFSSQTWINVFCQATNQSNSDSINTQRFIMLPHPPSCRRPTRSWTPSSHPGLLGSWLSTGRSFQGHTGSDMRSSSAWAQHGRNQWAHRNRLSSRQWGRVTAPGRFPEQSCCLWGEKRERERRKWLMWL